MLLDVPLPELEDETGEEASVSFWFFDEGETVEIGDDLVEVISDMAAFNVPAPENGKIAEILVGEGDTVKTGDILCRIETND